VVSPLARAKFILQTAHKLKAGCSEAKVFNEFKHFTLYNLQFTLKKLQKIKNYKKYKSKKG